MARIPQTVIDDIRERSNIVDIVGQYVQLKKSGKIILVCVRSIMKITFFFRCRGQTNFSLLWLWSWWKCVWFLTGA